MTKEFLYVGHYYDNFGNYILKIGTTNDLARRRAEHNRNYRKGKTHTMPAENSFEYDWTLSLSKYNTLRYEDSNRKKWQEKNVGVFVRNDRFNCGSLKPKKVVVKIRKEYEIVL